MIKKFFISMLGTMAGLWLSLIILFFGFFFAIGILVAKKMGPADISGDRILYIDLTGSIPEREQNMSFSDLLTYDEEPSTDLSSMLSALYLAQSDSNIKGVFVNCDASSMGLAARSELLAMLEEFKTSGKFVYAYADNFDQGDYYVASIADSVFINPVGALNVQGLASSTIFFKNILDKLGIDVNVVRVGSYKSAVEPFIRMDMSEESRMQTSVYVNAIWDDVTSSIAQNRKLKSADVVSQWADSLIFTWDPERYVECKAVSALRYRSQVERTLRHAMNIYDDKEPIPYVTVEEYMENNMSKLGSESKKHIAVLYAVGEIFDSGSDGIVAGTMTEEIEKLATDGNVSGLILRVNSPGGSAFASEQIWKALENFKNTGKPYYVSMSDYAASGGYYISCGADKIYADASTLTGSIGIFGVIPNAKRLLTDKIGLGYQTVASNPNANFPSLFEVPTASQLQAMQSYVERGYETFTSRVAMGRNIPVDSVKAIGGGRVWDGVSAQKLGLVDEIAPLATVISHMAEKTGLKRSDVVCYPANEMSMFEMLLKESKQNIDLDIDTRGLSQTEINAYRKLQNYLKHSSPVQARMENITIN